MEFEPVFPKSYRKGMKKLAIIFPNKMYGGVYSLGPLIVYNLVNFKENWMAERFFEDYLGNLKDFDIITFSVSWELDFWKTIKILKRLDLKDKVIAAGGPAVMINPNPFKKYFDVLFLFEAEAQLNKVLEIYEIYDKKEDFLEEVSKLEGVIVPGIKEETKIVKVKNLDEAPYPLYQPFPKEIDKRFVFGKVFMLEIARGCPFRCKFCTVPYLYSPFRIRSFEKIKEIVEEGYRINKRKKIIIYAPTPFHKDLKEILRFLLDSGFKFSLPSLRPEIIDEELIDLIVKGGQRTITLAPEVGSEDLRYKIGKMIRDDLFFKVARLIKDSKIKEIKLYFIVGLPGQDMKDIDKMVELVRKIKEISGKRIYVSANPFTPKRNTPFENAKFDKKLMKEMLKKLGKGLRDIGVRFSYKSIKIAYKEYIFNRME